MSKELNAREMVAWKEFCEIKTSYRSEEYRKDHVRFDFQFLFTTKEEYLTFKCFWKERYKELSLEIRAHKKAVRDEMKDQAKGGGEIIYNCWRTQGTLFSLQREARMMMKALEQAKPLAKIQAEASRTELVAANG